MKKVLLSIMLLGAGSVWAQGPGYTNGMGGGMGPQGGPHQNNRQMRGGGPLEQCLQNPQMRQFFLQQQEKRQAWRSSHQEQFQAMKLERETMRKEREAAQQDGVVTEQERQALMIKHQAFKEKAEKFRLEQKTHQEAMRQEHQAFCDTNSCPEECKPGAFGPKGGMKGGGRQGRNDDAKGPGF